MSNDQTGKLRAVLFDMDGTLIDMYERFVPPLEKALRRVKPDFDEEGIAKGAPSIFMQAGGRARTLMIRNVWSFGKHAGLNPFQRIRLLLVANGLKAEFRKIVPVEGAAETLRRTQDMGLKIALVTSGSGQTVEIAQQVFKELRFVDCVVHRDMVKKVKPHPAALILAMKELEVTPSECIMVGDLPLDVMGARAAGVTSVAVLGPLKEITEGIVRESKPDYLVDSIQELVPIIERLRGKIEPQDEG